MAASSAGTVTLVGGNNITLSTGASAITISGPNTNASHAVQTGISALSNSDTTYVSGTVGLSALTNITIRSTTGNQFQFSGNPAQTVQAESLSFGVSTGGNTVGDTGVATGQRIVMSGQGQVSLSQATGAGSTTVGISVPNSHAVQTGVSGISNSETVYTSGTVNLSGLGEVVVRSTTGNAFQISAPAHTVQTGISSIAGSDATYTSGQVQFTGSNMVTVKSSANQRIVIDATQSVQAESLSFGVSTGGNTAGNTGVATGQQIVLSGQGQVTLSEATGANSTTIGISVPNSHAQQTGISAISNSDTTYVSGTVGLSALTNITIRSTTGNQFQFSGRDAQTGISAISNSDATYTSGTVGLSGLANITIRSTTGNQFQFSVANPGGAPNPASYWANLDEFETTATQTLGASTSYMVPLKLPYDVSFAFLRMHVSGATAGASTTGATTNAGSGSASWVSTWNFQIFTQGAGANSLSLQTIASTTAGFTSRISHTANATAGSQWSGSTHISYPMSSGQTSTSSATNASSGALLFSTNLHASFTGAGMYFDIPFATSLAASNYWLGFGVSVNSATGGSATAMTIPRNSLSWYAVTQANQGAWAEMNVASHSSNQVKPGLGSFSVNAGATTGSVHQSQMSSSASHVIPYFQFRRTA